MFPWLFPYGKGGIGDTAFPDDKHKKLLMMYHDKRFQCDPTFAFVAFSHMQVKASTIGTFLLADKKNFQAITQWLMNVDQIVLTSLASRLANGEHVIPQSDTEKVCYQLIRDLDHVSGRVHGTSTTKCYMNSEIWSLIADKGAPSWYITLSLVDNRHPLCLYLAGHDEKFVEIPLLDYKQRQRLIVNNPAAAARFFLTFLSICSLKNSLDAKETGELKDSIERPMVIMGQ